MVEIRVADDADLIVRFGVNLGWEGGGSGHRHLQEKEAGVESCGSRKYFVL